MIPIINFKNKIMQKGTIIGIDVSAATLDICVNREQAHQLFIIENNAKSIIKFLKQFNEPLLIGMENTGRYNWALYEVLKDLSHRVYVIPPLHLKKSMGLTRGKNDKIDAIRIATFTEKNYNELKQWQPAPLAVQKLKVLLTERNSRIKDKAKLLKQRHGYEAMKHLGLDKELLKMNKEQQAFIERQISVLENKIEALIASDERMSAHSRLMRSVPGVGKVLCWVMLDRTEDFTAITEPRKMACYSGVVPFDNRSGTSVRGRNKLSHYADKTIKCVLHMAAMSAIRLKNDLREYYLRKVAEGKNKMSTLNAVRNKIVHRIFGCH